MVLISSVSRKRSLTDMQSTDGTLPPEHNDEGYLREVLQLEDGQNEAGLDESIVRQAEKLGITISRPPTACDNAQDSMCASTMDSHHMRTSSTDSESSNSTGITSRTSYEDLDCSPSNAARKRPISRTRKSLSFVEYEKYILHTEEQSPKVGGITPPSSIPREPAPSLFSVSTKRSYICIKNGFKSRLGKLRRNKTSQDESK